MIGDFKHPRKYRTISSINMGGGSFPLPHCADRIITGWWMIDQELDKLIDMLSKMKVGQVDDGFLPNTEKLALAASGIGCWSDFSPTLVYNWSPNWDKKLFNFCFEYSSSQSIDRTTHIQGKALKEVNTRRLKIKNQNFEALKNQASAEKSRLGIMKVSVWFSKVLLAILMGVLMLTKESIGSIGVLATLTQEQTQKCWRSWEPWHSAEDLFQ